MRRRLELLQGALVVVPAVILAYAARVVTLRLSGDGMAALLISIFVFFAVAVLAWDKLGWLMAQALRVIFGKRNGGDR